MYEISKFNPCKEAIKFRSKFNTFKETWDNCPRGDWMLWIAKKLDVDDRTLTLTKGYCAKTIFHLMRDERSKNAVIAAIEYGEGLISKEKLKTTIDAAYAAADAAANAAYVTTVNDDVAYAAYSAYSAYSAADAAASVVFDVLYVDDIAYVASADDAAYVAYAAADATADAAYVTAVVDVDNVDNVDDVDDDVAYSAYVNDVAYSAYVNDVDIDVDVDVNVDVGDASYAAYVAYIAKKNNQLETADICRKYLTKAVFEKLNIN